MLSSKFGIEIEFTGISRSEAADVVSKYLEGSISRSYDYYDTYTVTAPDGRNWKLMYDGSLHCRRRVGRSSTSAGSEYSCELVSPILIYREDIGTLQDIVRRLRKAGGMTNNSCGIHIHLDGAAHTPRSIRNFINLIASRNDLFYKALQIEPERMGYCKKMDAYLVKRMNESRKPFLSLRKSGTPDMAVTATVTTMTAVTTFSISIVSSMATTRLSFAALTASFMPERSAHI